MRKSRFSVEQIADALKHVEDGVPTAAMCRGLGISEQTFYVWKRRFGGMGAVGVARLRELEEENRRLKRIVGDLTTDKQMLQELLAKKT